MYDRKFIIFWFLCIFLSGCEPMTMTVEVIDMNWQRVTSATALLVRTDSLVSVNEDGKFFFPEVKINDTIIIKAPIYKNDTFIIDRYTRDKMTSVLRKQVP